MNSDLPEKGFYIIMKAAQNGEAADGETYELTLTTGY